MASMLGSRKLLCLMAAKLFLAWQMQMPLYNCKFPIKCKSIDTSQINAWQHIKKAPNSSARVIRRSMEKQEVVASAPKDAQTTMTIHKPNPFDSTNFLFKLT